MFTKAHVDAMEAAHGLRRKSTADLQRVASHFQRVAPLASVPQNRRDSEALVAAARRIIAEREQ